MITEITSANTETMMPIDRPSSNANPHPDDMSDDDHMMDGHHDEVEVVEGDEPEQPDGDDDYEDVDDSEPAGSDDELIEVEMQDDSVQGFFEHRSTAFSEPVYCIAMHPTQHDLIVSGGEDDMAYLWNARTGEQVHALGGHTDSVTSVAFSHDGALVATGAMDGVLFVWRVESGGRVAAWDGLGDEVLWVAWHPRGPVLLAGSTDAQVAMCNAATGALMGIFAGVHADAVGCGQFTPDGKNVVSASEDGSLALWSPTSFTPIRKWTADDGRWFQEEAITSLAIHRDGQVCMVGGSEGTARLINLANGNILASLSTHTASIESIAFSPTLSLVALASTDHKVSIIDITHHNSRATLPHDDAVVSAAWTADGLQLVTASTDRAVRVWDARSAQLVRKWIGHTMPIMCLAATPDAKLVVSGGDDGACLVFRADEAQAAASSH